jgi:hypothetical protein
MKKCIFVIMMATFSLHGMGIMDRANFDSDKEYSSMYGDAGRDYYSPKAEAAFLRKQKVKCEFMCLQLLERENRPRKRMRNGSYKDDTTLK